VLGDAARILSITIDIFGKSFVHEVLWEVGKIVALMWKEGHCFRLTNARLKIVDTEFIGINTITTNI